MTKTIRKLKAEFKEKVNHHKIYILCLIFLGISYCGKNLLLKGEKKIKKAQKALKKVTDYEDKKEKKQLFEFADWVWDEFFGDDDDDDDDAFYPAKSHDTKQKKRKIKTKTSSQKTKVLKQDQIEKAIDTKQKKRKIKTKISSQRAKVLKQDKTDKASVSIAQLKKEWKPTPKEKSSKK